MGKFRSKLKRHTKGKNWSSGQSSTANPENQKHRNRARSRYFRADLSLAPGKDDNSALTQKSVMRHEAQQALLSSKKKSEATVNDVAESLKSFNFNGADDDDAMSESAAGGGMTYKTFQTFATNYTQCTNQSFSKLLTGFRGDSEHHKEMLAILAAASEIINERKGKQSSTEYFLVLMETLAATQEEKEVASVVTLLGLGIKSVPEAVLRKEFSRTTQTLLELLARFKDMDNQSAGRNILGILSVFLRAQEYAMWKLSSTTKIFDILLTLITHRKPKVRKAAQHAVTSIILGSCFMQPDVENPISYHPAGESVTKYCKSKFSLDTDQTVILHVLGMLRTVIGGLRGEDVKILCEKILEMMQASNVLIRTNCFQTLHALFLSKSKNVNAELIYRLLAAIKEYQPDSSDVRQTLAWLTVLKQGHVYLTSLDPTLAIKSAVKLVGVCCDELWDPKIKMEIINNTTATIKELLEECVAPVCADDHLRVRNKDEVKKIIKPINKCLSRPFDQNAKSVVLTISALFKCTGKYFADELADPLKVICERYDENSVLRAQFEHAIIAAVASIGPEKVLDVIAIEENGEFILDRSWMLPLLRESIVGSTFEYFTNRILPLASKCNKLWNKYKGEKNTPLAHTYELLCCQLWGLFPGFCRTPIDPQNFKTIAKTLGTILEKHADLRAPVLDGLKELIENGDDDMKTELAKFAKNFMPLLFNVYTTKPTGTYEGAIHDKCFEVIKDYLTITSEQVMDNLFESAMENLKETNPGTFLGDSIFDVVEVLALFQSEAKLKSFYKKYIKVILKQEKSTKIVAADELRKRKQQKKCYSILEEIMLSETDGCVGFCARNMSYVEKLFVMTHTTTIAGARVARIKCLYTFFVKNEGLDTSRDIVTKAISEAIFVLHEFPKANNIAQKLIQHIGDLYTKEEKLNDMVDMLIAGFAGDQNLVGNTILALKIIVNHLSGHLTVNTLDFVLDQVLAFLVSKNRKHVESCISFMVTFVKVLPTPIVASHLEKICRSFSAMTPDTKRFCRTQYGYVLKRLCKRFGAIEITRLVPGNDETTHKRLKRIRKLLNREKRGKDSSKDDGDDDDEDDEELEKKTYTIDEILASSDDDSDSEIDENDNDKAAAGNKSKHPSKKRRKDQTYIQESPEAIVDLADMNTIGKITSSKPGASSSQMTSDGKQKKDPNRGFKMAEDGRLIITEDYNDDGSDSDGGVGMDVDETEVSKKRGVAEGGESSDEDADDEVLLAPTQKKKSLDSRSVGSRRTTASSRYTTGGKGIHRNTTAESVKSGGTTSLKRKTPGGDYKSKKASGDVKRKGSLDPYAYIPLERSNLNKRKKLKNQSEFKAIVKGARKGAAAGSKKKMQKAQMMMGKK